MLQLLIGLALFLGIHSLHSLAPGLRQNAIDRWGALGFKGVYSAVSLLGFVLLVPGYGQARLEPVVLWSPPLGMAHASVALMWLAMTLLVAAYVPGNALRARLRHPMTLSVKVWALAHLLANGHLVDVCLFGGFLLWSVLVFRAARQRDRLQPPSPARNRPWATALVLALGTGLWLAFWAGDLHLWLIGVSPIALPAAV